MRDTTPSDTLPKTGVFSGFPFGINGVTELHQNRPNHIPTIYPLAVSLMHGVYAHPRVACVTFISISDRKIRKNKGLCGSGGRNTGRYTTRNTTPQTLQLRRSPDAKAAGFGPRHIIPSWAPGLPGASCNTRLVRNGLGHKETVANAQLTERIDAWSPRARAAGYGGNLDISLDREHFVIPSVNTITYIVTSSAISTLLQRKA